MPQHIYGMELSLEIPLSGAIVIMGIHVKHLLCLMRSLVIFSGKKTKDTNQRTNKNENPCHVPNDSLKSFELVSINLSLLILTP